MRLAVLVPFAIASVLVGRAGAQGFDVRLLTDNTALGVPGIDPEVAINEQGAIAFVAGSFTSNAPHVWNAGAVAAVAPIMPSRQYFGAAINDAALPRVATRDRDPGSIFRIRKWPAVPDFNNWELVGNSPDDFDSCSGWVDINDNGVVCFPALVNGSSQTVLFAGISDPPTELATYSGNQALRPEIAETDEIVVREPSGSVVVWFFPLATADFVAGASNGFSGIGNYPGISSDGVVVGFTGDRGNGPGIFVSVQSPLGRQIVAVAGDGASDGFTGFDGNQRVGVATTGTLASGMSISVCYVGTQNGVAGLYQSEVSASFQGGQFTASPFQARRAVQVGDSVGGQTIAAIGLYHPMNRQRVIAFWAAFASGGTGVLRAVGDRDRDGLYDHWEATGIDVDGDGTSDFSLAALGADPDRKDVFVEIDAMVNNVPSANALADVEAAFASAPVSNPDGSMGVTLHALLDEDNMPESSWTTLDADGWPTDYDSLKSSWFGTVSERTDPNSQTVLDAKRQAFRYCIFARSFGPNGATGRGELPGNDFFVANFSLPTGSEEEVAGTFMHELGHSLGLRHGGGDGIAYKPNYFSVMNYSWQFPEPWSVFQWTLDYSRVQLSTVDEMVLDEQQGLGGPAGSVTLIGPQPQQVVPASGPVDFDGDGTIGGVVARDLNFVDPNDGPTPDDLLFGYDDWSNLVFDFKDSPDFADGVHVTAANQVEIDQAIASLLQNLQPAPAVYCTPKVNSLGCTPQIGFTGAPTLSGPDDFFVTAADVRNKKFGVLVWSTSSSAQPFQGGTLCVATPMLRVPILTSGGSASGNDCSGAYSVHFAQAYMTAQNLAAGTSVFAQIWSRDASASDPQGIGLTGGLCFVVNP